MMTGELAIPEGTNRALELLIATDEVIREWLEYERYDGKADSTLKTYERSIRVFIDWLHDNKVDQVSPVVVNRFKADLSQRSSVQTVNLRLSAVRSFYRFCVNTERLAVNPAGEVKGVKRVKSKKHKRDELTNGEVLAVLDTCDLERLDGIRDRAILSLMAFCALRTVEVHRANIGDLRTYKDRLVLDVWGKGRLEVDEQAVIPRDEEPVIRAWLKHRRTFADHAADAPLFVSLSRRSRGSRLALRSIRGMVKARYELAGVVGERKTTHSLRHSAITNLIRRGGTPLQAQSLARHTSMDTTLGYYHEVSRLDNPPEDLIDYSNGQS